MSLSFSSNQRLTAPSPSSNNLLYAPMQEKEKENRGEYADQRLFQPTSNFHRNRTRPWPKYLFVIPVLFMEFLALALTRAVVPPLLLYSFGDNVYVVMGLAECIRGILSFISCPLFGKISDVIGRKICLFITVGGTLLPASTFAIMTLLDEPTSSQSPSLEATLTHRRVWIFVMLLALSGIFTSTFTLTLAYISDTVRDREKRIGAYGLALGTFGLSFTIGPMTGGYLARVEEETNQLNSIGNSTASSTIVGTVWSTLHTNTTDEAMMHLQDSMAQPQQNNSTHTTNYVHFLGQKRVFIASLLLTLMDLAYIYFILPESIGRQGPFFKGNEHEVDNDDDDDDDFSSTSSSASSSQWDHLRREVLPYAWRPMDTLKIFTGDPLMYQVGIVALLYYTSMWAVVSTLMIYAAKRFSLGPERLGELISILGLCTMISEAVLVRLVVPALGEKTSIRVGLAAFTIQCVVLALAYEGWQLFFCVLLSMAVNLVYPSLTSMVTSFVAPQMVGTALGAMNGVKAFTEGLGPLLFGTLMTMSEKSSLPGWPYLIAAFVAYMAYSRAQLLPDENEEDYISEKYTSKWIGQRLASLNRGGSVFELVGNFARRLEKDDDKLHSSVSGIINQQKRTAEDEEYLGLLSEVEEESDYDEGNNKTQRL